MMPLTGKYLNHTSGAKLLGILAMGMRPVPLGDAYAPTPPPWIR